MSDPRRLVEEDELARLLLGSASWDRPSAEGRARARRAALSAAAVSLSAGGSVSLIAGGAKAAGKISSAMVLKWLALASVPAALVAGVVVTQLNSATPPLQAAMSVSLPQSAPVPSQHVSVNEAAPAYRPADSAEETPPDSRPASPDRAGPGTTSRVVVPSLQAEITRLDAARHALARGDASVLDSYLAEYPRGALREQALWMKISNLEQTGRKAQARALAKRLAASYPNGAYAARARALAVP